MTTIRHEITCIGRSRGRIITGEGAIATVQRGQVVFVRIGGEYPQGLANGRRFRVSNLMVDRLTLTRVHLIRTNGRGAWRKHGEIFLTFDAACKG